MHHLTTFSCIYRLVRALWISSVMTAFVTLHNFQLMLMLPKHICKWTATIYETFRGLWDYNPRQQAVDLGSKATTSSVFHGSTLYGKPICVTVMRNEA